MVRTVATVLSFRPNEIRLDEVAGQLDDVEQFDVLVLDDSGREQVIAVEYGPKWGGNWRKEMQCHGCVGTARVLHVAFGMALCRKCWPVPTAIQTHKNSARWRGEGALLDEVLRSVRKGKPTRAARRARQRLATKLIGNSLSNASQVIERVARLIHNVDNLPR